MPMFVFLWPKGQATKKQTMASAIHSEMRPVYSDKYFTRPAIHAWCKKFAGDRESVDDKKRPGQHVVATTDAATATSDEFIRSDQRA